MKAAPLVTGDDLHAYAVGQLSPERAAEVGDALERDPALAARLTDIRQQNTRLRAALDPWLDEPLPRELVLRRLHATADAVEHLKLRLRPP